MGWLLTGATRTVATYLIRPVDPTSFRAIIETLRQVFVSGASITAPFVVTLVVLGVVIDFVGNLLSPFAQVLAMLGLTGGQTGILAQALTLGIMFGVIFLAGVLAESGPTTTVGANVGRAVEAVPGIGSVYTSFDRMSEVMLDGDAESFREVKLIEFPHSDIYSLAFETAKVEGDTAPGEDTLVLFVPLAPNPVMGGFMVCVPASNVRDVDMTVQEAFQALVTSGVAWDSS